MRLTTKSRFAVTAMVELALSYDFGKISLSIISERHNISLSYLEQLFIKLRKKSLVVSVRGSSGGYYLSKSPSEITIADIIIAVDEELDSTNCRGKVDCNKDYNGKVSKCITHDLWTSFNQKMFNYLNSISLRDLLDNKHQSDSLKCLKVNRNAFEDIVFL